LDHVRDYFHADAFLYDPTDPEKTSVVLFLTRWITHFCAPVFMLLSGTSAFLVGERKGKKELSKFLLTRGLWLIVLEFTVVNFGWLFEPTFPMLAFLVIWALGVSMIVLAGLIWLPLPAVLTFSLVLIFGHNLLDGISFGEEGAGAFAWAILHKMAGFTYLDRFIFVAYPLIPWVGVMSLGYCLGYVYVNYDAANRKKFLIVAGLITIALFVVIRYINLYGDPAPWSSHNTVTQTMMSFLRVSKYPPSLLYLLATLGPAMVFLAFTERASDWLSDKLITIGRVPMFYYLIHLFMIHLGAMLAAQLTGYGWTSMVLEGWVSFSPGLQGYGFSLPIVYIIWLSMVAGLYFLCRWYERYKKAHSYQWWLSYV
jgi:uncharacterized membrane protein